MDGINRREKMRLTLSFKFAHISTTLKAKSAKLTVRFFATFDFLTIDCWKLADRNYYDNIQDKNGSQASYQLSPQALLQGRSPLPRLR